MENKFGKIKTLEEAMSFIKDGCTIMIGGFGGHGSPYDLCQAILRSYQSMQAIRISDLTISSGTASAKNSSQAT